MRTTLDLPADLIEQARAAVGFKSKTDTVVFALRELIRRQRLEELKALMRSVTFEFDPAEVRKRDRARVRGRRP
jgi:Arc/MetJ family transcription regulator